MLTKCKKEHTGKRDKPIKQIVEIFKAQIHNAKPTNTYNKLVEFLKENENHSPLRTK